ASAPDSAVLGGSYDESFMAKVVYDKCAMHLPLYRQAEQLRSLGLDIPRQTLSRIYMQSADVLFPLWRLMKERIIESGIIFTDDTPVNMLEKGRGKTRTGRMWAYVGGGKSPPYRVFEFTVDRSKKRPKKFLENFRGYIHADAYKGYDDLFARDGVRECACWMHARRKFVDANDAPPELRDEILRMIRHLYMYERFIWKTGPADMPTHERHELATRVRKEKTAPLIDRLFERTKQAILNREVLPGSAFDKAIAYMRNLGDALKTFTENPYLKPDNGESERAIRPLAIGRKNWLFAGCEKGGDATGILLSLVQTCRAMNVEPFAYLEDVLRRISSHPASRLEELLPDQWEKSGT
ncbi:MAG: IS66 family transposase, partial [Desulfuromonadales bacterium]|nr:IS66 family transposase [Desulfuromonadales bacterium]